MNPNWTDEIERDILALFVQDPLFASMVMDELKPSHLSPAISVVYGAVRDHYKKYGEMPGDTVLYDSLRATLGESDAQFLRPTILAIFREVADRQYVHDRVVTFINLRNLEASVRVAEEHILTGSYEEAYSSIVSFREIGPKKTINYFDDGVSVVDAEAIPTGIAELDGYLNGGGLQRKRLGIILAGTGVGKSALQINIAAHDVRMGYRVLHITGEDSREAVKYRYDRRFSGNTNPSKGRTEVEKRLIESARSNGGDLTICEMISGKGSPSFVRAQIQALGVNKPDVVMVDYLDIMRPDQRRVDKRFEHEDIAMDLRGIAQEFECAVWLGKQGDRQSRQAEIVGAENSAESYGPMRIADVVLGMARPRELKRMNRMDIFLDKQRDGIDGVSVGCTEDRARMLIRGMVSRDEIYDRRRSG